MTPSFPLDAHAFLALVGALLARPCVLTFAIFLSAPFTSQLDELRSTSDMNTLFVPRNTSRTRPLIVALTDPYRSSKPAPKGQTNTHAPSCYPDDSSDKPTWPARSSGDSEERTRAGRHRTASPSQPAPPHTLAPVRGIADMVCRLHSERALCDSFRIHRYTDRWCNPS